MPRGVPVENGVAPSASPGGGWRIVRRYRPEPEYSTMTPLNTLETYQPPRGAGTIALGVASGAFAGMNMSLRTFVVIGAPVASWESHPPRGVFEVGNGAVYRCTPNVVGRADAT